MPNAKSQLMKVMDSRFGNPLNNMRCQVVTVTAVDYANSIATVQFGQGDPLDAAPDPADVRWLDSYFPLVNDLAYLGTLEGAPILLGAVDTEVWHDLTLPSGYSVTSPYRAPAYRRDNQGRVWFKGECNVAASNAIGTKFTMPVGYRPTIKTTFSAPVSNGTTITSTFPGMRYDVNTDGTIVTLIASPAATQLFMFEGVSYDTRP